MLGLELYYSAFLDLTTCRPSGWDVTPIPWMSIAEYAILYEFNKEEADDLIHCIRAMDQAYMEHVRKKNERKK